MSTQPSPEVLNIAILGFAHGHCHQYAQKIATFDDAGVVAGWDSDVQRGEAGCAQHGIEFIADVDALLARDDIHAVIVTSETNKHTELILKACAAGKHILCQKPMATTLEDCDTIIEAVEKSGVHFQMAFQMRCDPLNIQMKKWIDEGAIGRVGAIRRRHCINFLFAPGIAEGPNAWHVSAEANVGMYFDDAVHATDFFLWLFGAPKSVMAEIDNVLTDVAPDDTGLAIYRWGEDAAQPKLFGALFNASVTLAGENTCEIYGDEGVIIQNGDDLVSTIAPAPNLVPLKLWRKSTGAWEVFEYSMPASHAERLQAIPRYFVDNIKNGAPPMVSARDGKISVAMCVAAYTSAREGRRVELNEVLS